jgi:hypothetical protein
MNCQRNVTFTLPTQLPHKFSYIVAILGHNHFESPNMCTRLNLCALVIFLSINSLKEILIKQLLSNQINLNIAYYLIRILNCLRTFTNDL